MNKIQEAQKVAKLYRKMYKSKSKNVNYKYKQFGNDEFCTYKDARNKIFYIVFDGSSDVKEWKGNFKAIPKFQTDFGKIHKNYWKAHVLFKSQHLQEIFSFVLENRDEWKTVIVGFSRGGPQALLLGYHLKYISINFNVEIYTFGSPRCFDIDLYNSFKGLMINYTEIKHWGDLVPKLPYKFMGFEDNPSNHKIMLGKKRNRIFRFIPFTKIFSTIKYHTCYTDKFITDDIKMEVL